MLAHSRADLWSSVARAALASLAVAGLTGVCHRLGFDVTTTALLDLIAIVLWSLGGRFAVAAIASVAATLSLNYFLVARAFSFPERWLDLAALGAFLTTALVITRLLSRVRESLREARRSEAYLAEAQRLSHTGSWATDLRQPGKHYTSPEVSRILGLDPAAGELSDRTFQDRVHPDDLPSLRERMATALRDQTDFDLELRVVRPDGSIRLVYLVGHPVLETGQVVELVGTVMDITERRRAERAIRRARERALHARFDAVLDERTRLAREIHDTLLQGFTGVALKLVAAINRFGGSPEAASTL
jgi:PAS domain S-box-containing protein